MRLPRGPPDDAEGEVCVVSLVPKKVYSARSVSKVSLINALILIKEHAAGLLQGTRALSGLR